MPSEADLYALAVDQGGVVTRDQALAHGLSRSTIHRWLESERWHREMDGVYRLVPMTSRLAKARAAVAVLPNAAVSHFSAAALHGMERVPIESVSVTVHSSTTHAYPGVSVMRCRDLDETDLVRISSLPVTSPARTVFDLAGLLTYAHIEVVADDAVAARLVDWSDIRRVVERVGRRGKRGTASVRRLLLERTGEAFQGSVLEARGRALLLAANIADFETEHTAPWDERRRLDIAFVDSRTAVEWDSRRWHLQAAAFRADRERDRAADLHGWQVLRFTWDDVERSPSDVVDTVRAVVARRSVARLA